MADGFSTDGLSGNGLAFMLRRNTTPYIEPATGPPWVDITPSIAAGVSRRLFLPDDSANYDFKNEGVLGTTNGWRCDRNRLFQEIFRRRGKAVGHCQ